MVQELCTFSLTMTGQNDVDEALSLLCIPVSRQCNGSRVISVFSNCGRTENKIAQPSILLLFESCSFLQVTRASKTSRMSSKFGQIGLRAAELAALGRLEKSP